MSKLSHKDYTIRFLRNHFIGYYQGEYEVWKVAIKDIVILVYFSGMNGDNDTDIVVLIDANGNRYSIDLGIGISNYEEVVKWLTDRYDFAHTQNLPFDETPRIFYPQELFGINPFDSSIHTWLTQNFINSGNGRLNKKTKDYLSRYRNSI